MNVVLTEEPPPSALPLVAEAGAGLSGSTQTVSPQALAILVGLSGRFERVLTNQKQLRAMRTNLHRAITQTSFMKGSPPELPATPRVLQNSAQELSEVSLLCSGIAPPVRLELHRLFRGIVLHLQIPPGSTG